MGLSYANNTQALKAAAELNRHTNALSESFRRLSSGLRIVDAADDPAGLAVAEALKSDSQLASTAIRNANHGISTVVIADAALEEIYNILTRMSELANQSTNSVYTQAQRSALSSEFILLGSEIERIALSTEYNSATLLSNSSNLTLQVGLDGSVNSTIKVASVLGTLASINLASGSNISKLSYSIITTTTAGSETAAAQALAAVNAALDSVTVKRGTLGAAESRLKSAVSNLTVLRENLVAAESRIRDIDVASETANMVRLTILQQGAAAVLAQANLQPEVALRLLQ